MFKFKVFIFYLTFILLFLYEVLLFRRSFLSLIGNPVKIGDGPAAVTLPFSDFVWEKGTLLAMMCHFSNMDGKAAKRAGKSEDLSGQ